MNPRIPVTLALFLVSIVLSACLPEQALAPTLTLTPTLAPLPTQTPAPTPAPTPASAITLDCTDQAAPLNGSYKAENNTWGKGDLTGWSQCIGLGNNADGTLTARWTWDWPERGSDVKAYPEIVFGQKPGGKSTAAVLPIQINQVAAAAITYDVTSTFTGSGNLAFDFWLTDTNNPIEWGVPPITHEIMIWLDRYGSMGPGGSFVERITLDGNVYAVYVADNWGGGWRYIAFVSTETQQGARTLNLASFLAYLVEKELVTGEEYLASIEFGNEVVSGAGETLLRQYGVSVQEK